METINIKVPSELYGVTDCVISLDAINKGFAPCGDGCDYRFTHKDLELLKRIAAGENLEFKPEKIIKYKNRLTLQELTDLKNNSAVLPGKSTPGKIYDFGNGLRAKCTQWFSSGSVTKSHFVKI